MKGVAHAVHAVGCGAGADFRHEVAGRNIECARRGVVLGCVNADLTAASFCSHRFNNGQDVSADAPALMGGLYLQHTQPQGILLKVDSEPCSRLFRINDKVCRFLIREQLFPGITASVNSVETLDIFIVDLADKGDVFVRCR